MDGDERAQFERAMMPHLDAAFNLARWMTRDDHAAEDVVQESYARAAKYFRSFRGGDGRAWLLGVVRRASFDWLAKHRTAGAVSYDEDLHDEGDESTDPFAVALRECEAEVVRAALEELPPPLREAIVLREVEGLSYREIAAISGAPIGTVMSRLCRGRRELQRLLAPEVERGE